MRRSGWFDIRTPRKKSKFQDKLIKIEVQGRVIKDQLDGRVSNHPGHHSSEFDLRNWPSCDDVVR